MLGEILRTFLKALDFTIVDAWPCTNNCLFGIFFQCLVLTTCFLSFSQFLVLTLGNHRYWLQEALGVEARVLSFFPLLGADSISMQPYVLKPQFISFCPFFVSQTHIPFENPLSSITLFSIFCHCSLYFLPLSLQLSLSPVSWPVAGIWQIYVDCLSVIILISKRVNSLSSHSHKQNILSWA